MAARMDEAHERKEALARAAVPQIQRGELVFLDSGSTNLALVGLLPEDYDLTVATNSIDIAAAVLRRADLLLIMIGGAVDPAVGGCVDASAVRDVGAAEYRPMLHRRLLNITDRRRQRIRLRRRHVQARGASRKRSLRRPCNPPASSPPGRLTGSRRSRRSIVSLSNTTYLARNICVLQGGPCGSQGRASGEPGIARLILSGVDNMSSDRPATRLATRLAFLVAGFGVACWAPLVPFAQAAARRRRRRPRHAAALHRHGFCRSDAGYRRA